MSAPQINAGWDPVPPLPTPNGGFACGVVAGKIVVIGGSNWEGGNKQWLDSIWAFDPESLKWEIHGKLPHPLAYAVTSPWKHGLLIAGGSDGQQPRKEVWHMLPSLKLEKAGELRTDAVLSAGGVLGESLFIVGGCANAAKLDGMHRGGGELDLRTGKITAFESPGEVAFGLAASVALGRELFLFGGARYDPTTEFVSLPDSWAYNAGKASWRSLKPYPLVVHASAAVILDKHHILVAGGYGGDPLDFTAAAFIYDTRRDAYAKTLDLPVAGQVGMVRAGDYVYCLGGEDKSPRHRTAACARVKVDTLVKAASID